MRFAPLAQKFEVVLESHWFLYRFIILSRVIILNACLHTYALDSIWEKHGFHFLMRKLGISSGWLWPLMKLIGEVDLIILFHLAPSRMLYNKYWRQKIGEKWSMLTTCFLTATAVITGIHCLHLHMHSFS